ncbi:MAG TPA: YihY/virulence factor BrkB family protein [Acetobacteraceae bacterium]|nr:YihY/virulence factor BrkB family protein [Acetobacteraceae bacterium]
MRIPSYGWKAIAWRAFAEMNNRNLFLVAGGVSYYVLLALFPGLVALVSIYGLVSDPAQVEKQVDAMSGMLPESARELVASELHSIVTASGRALSFGVVIGILFAIWSASRGMSGLMSALDISYGETDSRSFLRFNLTALVLTLVLLIGGIVAVALVALLPAVVTNSHSGILGWVLLIAEWPVLFLLVLTGFALLYRFAPDRHPPKWRWLTPGAAIAAFLWIVGSILFSVYVSHFSNYNATYGSLGAVVVLLTWLYLSAFVVLLGALINAEAERQTRHDANDKTPKPIGHRGAHAADTVGPSAGR